MSRSSRRDRPSIPGLREAIESAHRALDRYIAQTGPMRSRLTKIKTAYRLRRR